MGTVWVRTEFLTTIRNEPIKYNTQYFIIITLLSLINAIMIDVIFTFPLGWVISVLLPVVVEKFPMFLEKLRLFVGFKPLDDIDVASMIDDYRKYGLHAFFFTLTLTPNFVIVN